VGPGLGRNPLLIDQLEEGLVDQGRRLEGVVAPPSSSLSMRDRSQFVVQDGEQFVSGGITVGQFRE
jgi:hypothetical protein